MMIILRNLGLFHGYGYGKWALSLVFDIATSQDRPEKIVIADESSLIVPPS
ncbi:MAG: hypothetical protein ACJAW8_000444 [Oleispira sp.]|jgi:hypothetical protein